MGGLRRFSSLVVATAREILSEPLSLLVLISAIILAVLAPAFHYHQFGEPTRMARDAGFSSLFVGGLILAIFGTIRSFRREIEMGTMEMALTYPITRTFFFLAKCVGAFGAYLVFALIIFLTTLVVVDGAAIGGEIATRTGDIARIWGPCLAAGIGVVILPLLGSAFLNRFANFRFVLTSFLLAIILSVLFGCGVVVHAPLLVLKMLPVAILLVTFTALFLLAAAAFSTLMRANAAATCVGLVFVLLLPIVGNYYLSESLTGGGSISWGYVAGAILAVCPAAFIFLLIGIHFINRRTLS